MVVPLQYPISRAIIKKGPIGLQKAYTEIEARLWANYTLKPGIPNVSNRPVSKFVGVLIGGHPPASPP